MRVAAAPALPVPRDVAYSGTLKLEVDATDGDDTINVQGDTDIVKLSGLAATVALLHSEGANDRLEVNTLGGRDAVDSSGLAAGAIQLLVDGIPVP